MSKVITQGLEGGIMHSFSLVNEFIKVCPENVWGKVFGKWPVWQQLYHSFAAVDFFLRSADDAAEACPFGEDAANLSAPVQNTPSKADVQAAIEKAQARVTAYIATLDDAALAAKHEGLSTRMGRDMTHAATLNLIACHTMYHLGSCDAALRENGISGVF